MAGASTSMDVDRVATRAPKIIVSFMFKGGVGKTTNALNLACELARGAHGKKTLLVDADPQCNLTRFFQAQLPTDNQQVMDPGTPNLQGLNDEEVRLDDPLVNATNPAVDLVAWLAEAANGNQAAPQAPANINESLIGHDAAMSVEMLKAHQLPQLEILENACPNKNLFLLPGSSDFSDFEEELQACKKQQSGVSAFGFFRVLLHALAEKHSFEYIVIDTPPSSGLLNTMLVMSSDYIMPSVAADSFSLSSINAFLGHLMPKWMKWQQDWKADEQRHLARMRPGLPNQRQLHQFAFKAEPPRILPFLVTGYVATKPPNKSEKRVHKSYAGWVLSMRQLVDGGYFNIDPNMPAVQPLFCRTTAADAHGTQTMVVAFVRQLFSTLKFTYMSGVPLVNFTREDVNPRNIPSTRLVDSRWDSSNQLAVAHARAKFGSLARFIDRLP